MKKLGLVAIAAALALTAADALAIKAFPGAEGFGSLTTGGRGGTVYKVTNLNNSGTGSFRDAIQGGSGNRTIIFDTGGTVTLATRSFSSRANVTLAGQTAPGGGFCVRNGLVQIKNTSGWVIRHLRMRLGRHAGTGTGSEPWFDSFNVWNCSEMVVDHCSMSWGCDECADIKDNSTNITLQWCIFSEGLNWYEHGYAVIFEPNGITQSNATMHHNLIAHHLGRTPRASNEYGNFLFDYRNNVQYNWGTTADWGGWYAAYSNEKADMNYVSNYGIAGPNTTTTAAKNAIISCNYNTGRTYQSGNKIDSDRDTVRDGTNTGWTMFRGPETHMGTPFTIPADYAVTTSDVDTAYTAVLNGAGATKPSRDSVDTRIVNDVINFTGTICNDEDNVGGWPTLDAGTPPTDTDGDGMPDAWESANGTDPAVADNNGDLDSDGYTNIEEYINSL